MNFRCVILISFVFYFNVSSAQKIGVIYNLSDYAVAGDTFRYSKSINYLKFNFDTTGEDIVWDYSDIQSYAQDTFKIITPKQSGYVFTPSSFQQKLDLAIPLRDTITVSTYQISNLLGFFNNTNNEVSQLAVAGKVNGTSVKSEYSSPDVNYIFPLQYGNAKDSSNSSFTVSIPFVVYYKHTQKRVNSIIGYGTVKTPYGVFNTIKFQTIIYSKDTFSLSGKGMPSYSYTTTEYQWLSPSKGLPVFDVLNKYIKGINVSETVEYLDSARVYKPIAAFTYKPIDPIFKKDTVIFYNYSYNATSYLWNFGDSTTSTTTDSSLQHMYKHPGKFKVTLTAYKNDYSDTLSSVINVIAEPKAGFTVSGDTVNTGTTVYFTNTSENSSSYMWKINNVPLSTDKNASHTFNQGGTYKVTLIALNYYLTDSISMNITVNPLWSISGYVSYDNKNSTPLEEVTVYLKDSENDVIDTAITDVNGYYIFNKAVNGEYTINAYSDAPTGGINSIDALMVIRESVKLYIITDKLKLLAADVNNDKTINSIDALFINRYFVKLITSFPAGKWVFGTFNPINVSAGNINYNFKGICVGDIEGKFVPADN